MIGQNAMARMSLPQAFAVPASAFARVEAFTDAAMVDGIWADLETQAPCSIYQTRAWLRPWIDTLGRKAGLTPVYAVARGADGTAAALLCFGIRRSGPFRIATFLGGKDSNLNMPLVRPSPAWTAPEVGRLLRDAAKALGANAPDVFELSNQPLAWRGVPNPFAAMPRQDSPSFAYGTDLPGDAETLFTAKLSKETRKKLRKKENKLAALGPVTHVVAADAEMRRRVLDAFIDQKLARFRELNIRSEFDTPEMRDFIGRASAADAPGIELHALLAGERIVATYGGASHDGQWSGMFNSFDADEDIAKSSPGDLLLMRIIAKACDDGCERFDLGIGEARYKAALCGEAIALFDTFVPVSTKGAVLARLIEARQAIKRVVKGNKTLLTFVTKLRALR